MMNLVMMLRFKDKELLLVPCNNTFQITGMSMQGQYAISESVDFVEICKLGEDLACNILVALMESTISRYENSVFNEDEEHWGISITRAARDALRDFAKDIYDEVTSK